MHPVYHMFDRNGHRALPLAGHVGARAHICGKDVPSLGGVLISCPNKLYASTDDGRIFWFDISAGGTLSSRELIEALKTAAGASSRAFCFEPREPAPWVADGYYAFENTPNWTGKITRMNGPGLNVVQDVLINLPRSYRDHFTNQPSFGPDGAIYFPQGSKSANGAPDATWGNRIVRLLNATVLRLDLSRLTTGQPPDFKTSDAGGSYDPYAAGAALTIYATGIRNAFDLVWHSNGRLYVPTIGSSPGGNTPAGPGAPGLQVPRMPISDKNYARLKCPGIFCSQSQGTRMAIA